MKINNLHRIMGFVEQLLERFNEKFQASVSHPLTNELCDGTLPDHILYTYLVQDLKFVEIGLRFFGNALARCEVPAASVTLGKQIGFISNFEYSYFVNCMNQLREESGEQLNRYVPLMLKETPPALPAVQKYLDVLHYLACDSRSYEELITFLYVLEKCYLGWVVHNTKTKDLSRLQYKHKEWVDLHYGPDFEAWVEFLRGELERVAAISEDTEKIAHWFEKTIDLEIEFFDACYFYKG
ncbi:hypothetical protein PUMCH_003290 [Australozyma saopauloensis]|uniref:Thiaminase-2/PQQC domain-containing protein n=1 Tax=Australozyma saopauloensis TaxID=291208 RepID=A0AAX4HC37_9ASCO|nr:hypothetical protein PUMCH_003290 [[Candida] saopauloensis]